MTNNRYASSLQCKCLWCCWCWCWCTALHCIMVPWYDFASSSVASSLPVFLVLVLDDRHRNPNINIRGIIWLVNQLVTKHFTISPLRQRCCYFIAMQVFVLVLVLHVTMRRRCWFVAMQVFVVLLVLTCTMVPLHQPQCCC